MKSWKTSVHLLLLVLLFVPLLSGCWDRLEIEDRANVLGMSIDVENPETQQDEPEVSHLKGSFPVPTPTMIRLTAQIAVPGRIPLGPGGSSGSVGSKQKPVWVVSVVGHTLDDAMMNLQQQLADRVFLSHLRVIIISEEYARLGVENVNEYLRRNPEVRRAAWLLVCKGKAAKMMEISPELQRVPALYLMSTVDHAVALGKFPNDFLGIFWSMTSKLGQEPYLPYIESKAHNTVEIAGMAYFREDKLVGVTKALEIGEYMAIKGLNPGGYLAAVTLPGKKQVVMTHTTSRKSKIEVDLRNGIPHATIRVAYEAELEEKPSVSLQVDKSDLLHQIEQSAAQADATAMKEMIKETQKRGADIFGFGEYVRATQPRYWDSQVKTSQKWAEIYPSMTCDVKVTPHIRRVGMTAR